MKQYKSTKIIAVLLIISFILAGGIAIAASNNGHSVINQAVYSTGEGITPYYEPDNPTCGGGYDYSIKIDEEPENGIYEIEDVDVMVGDDSNIDDLQITISNSADGYFDWSSNYAISFIIVKASDGAYLYEYDPAVKSDTGLYAPLNNGGQQADVSHVIFCFDEPVTQDITITIDKEWLGQFETRPEGWKVEAYIPGVGDAADEILATLEGNIDTDSFDIEPGTTFSIRETGIDNLPNWVVSGDIGEFTPVEDTTYTVTNTYRPDDVQDITITLKKEWRGSFTNRPSDWKVEAYISGEEANEVLATLELDKDEASFEIEPGTTFNIRETGISGQRYWSVSGDIGEFTPVEDTTYTVTNTYREPNTRSDDPDIRITKTADPTSANVGDEVTYTYIVTNTGDVTLSNVEVEDDKLGSIDIGSTTLAPGAVTTGTATYIIQEADAGTTIVNIATATGNYLNSTVSDDDTARVNVREDIIIPPPPPEQKPKEPEVVEIQVEPELPMTGANGMLALALSGIMLSGGLFLRRYGRK